VANRGPDARNADLRPIIARLKEIERKCESMGTRNEEFPLMKERLASIIARLEAGEEPGGEALGFAAMARELFPVAHLFESVGFMSVGKEIAHIERALRELAPEGEPAAGTAPPSRLSTTSSAAAPPPPEEIDEKGLEPGESEREGERERVPKPVLGGFFVLVAAIAVAAMIVLKVGPFSRPPDPTPVPATPTVVPSPTPEPLPTPVVPDPDARSTPRERLADALAQAQQSLAEGDVDAAVGYLAFAELIDRNDPRVMKVADRVVDQLIGAANAAADEERWGDAAEKTAQARTVAGRFGIETDRINEAESDHWERQQFRIVDPQEIGVLRAAIGKRVEVMLDDGSRFAGILGGFKGSDLILDVEDDVGGGVVSFTDEIPLDAIDWIKIRED
jgi:hypothetical protein